MLFRSGKRQGITPLSHLIAENLGVSSEVAAALRQVFPNEMSAELVHDLASSNAGGVKVNFDGEMLIGERLFIGGSGESSGANESLLAFKRELHELGVDTQRLANEIDSATAAVEQARAELVELESKTVDLQSLIIKVDRRIHGLQIQLHGAHEEITRAERHQIGRAHV